MMMSVTARPASMAIGTVANVRPCRSSRIRITTHHNGSMIRSRVSAARTPRSEKRLDAVDVHDASPPGRAERGRSDAHQQPAGHGAAMPSVQQEEEDAAEYQERDGAE